MFSCKWTPHSVFSTSKIISLSFLESWIICALKCKFYFNKQCSLLWFFIFMSVHSLIFVEVDISGIFIINLNKYNLFIHTNELDCPQYVQAVLIQGRFYHCCYRRLILHCSVTHNTLDSETLGINISVQCVKQEVGEILLKLLIFLLALNFYKKYSQSVGLSLYLHCHRIQNYIGNTLIHVTDFCNTNWDQDSYYNTCPYGS